MPRGRLLLLQGQHVVSLKGGSIEDATALHAAVQVYAGGLSTGKIPSRVEPVLRVGCLWSGAMPQQAGSIDPGWASALEDTIEAAAQAGVYVFLEAHQDALAPTNGGEGIPAWVASHFQTNQTIAAPSLRRRPRRRCSRPWYRGR